MAPTKHLLHLFQRNAVASGWSYPHLSKGSLIRRRGNVQLFGVVFASSAASIVSSSSSSSAATTTTNYFDILGVEQSFLQSPIELKAKYKSLMNQFHPDRHHSLASSASSNDDDEEEVRSQMATMATDVTRAYSVLEEPLSRSLHLLELGGEAISETDRSIVNNHLLMKIMMVREEVDSASTDEELRPILQSCREEQDELCEKLAASFQKDRMVDAKYLTAELQYWKRVEETIIEKMKSVD